MHQYADDPQVQTAQGTTRQLGEVLQLVAIGCLLILFGLLLAVMISAAGDRGSKQVHSLQ